MFSTFKLTIRHIHFQLWKDKWTPNILNLKKTHTNFSTLQRTPSHPHYRLPWACWGCRGRVRGSPSSSGSERRTCAGGGRTCTPSSAGPRADGTAAYHRPPTSPPAQRTGQVQDKSYFLSFFLDYFNNIRKYKRAMKALCCSPETPRTKRHFSGATDWRITEWNVLSSLFKTVTINIGKQLWSCLKLTLRILCSFIFPFSISLFTTFF